MESPAEIDAQGSAPAAGQGWFHPEIASRGAAEEILSCKAAMQPDALLYLVRPRAGKPGTYALSTLQGGKFAHQLLAQPNQGSPFTINGQLLKNAGVRLAEVVPNVVRQLANKTGSTAAPVTLGQDSSAC